MAFWASAKFVPGMSLQGRTVIVKRVGCNIILCTKKSLGLVPLRPVKDNIHRLVHRYEKGNSSSFGCLRKILKNPKKALKIRGSKKANLVILLAIREYNIIPDAFTDVFEGILNGLPESIRLGRTQKKILRLFSGDSEMMRSLLYKNPRLFLDFVRLFNGKNLDAFEKELGALREIERYKNSIRGDYSLPVRMHCDFCIENANSTATFSDEYQKMIDGIKRRKPYGFLVRESCFYPEVVLYNDFMLSRIDRDFFDRELLNRSFVTKNEILVRNYIRRQMQKENKTARK